jgi:hypothetical protein
VKKENKKKKNKKNFKKEEDCAVKDATLLHREGAKSTALTVSG